MSFRPLTILITAIEGGGHFYACIGLAEKLRDRGHRIVFVTPNSWRNKLSCQGFIEEWLDTNEDENGSNIGGDGGNVWGDIVSKMAESFKMTPAQQIKTILHSFFLQAEKTTKENEPILRRIVQKMKPDVIITDLGLHQPAVMDSGIPWINFFSAITPSLVSNKNVPPALSGLPTSGNREDWEKYMAENTSVYQGAYEEFSKRVVANGGPSDLKFHQIFLKFSKYANIYICPQEMDFTEYRPNPPNFFRFDPMIRQMDADGHEHFKIPPCLEGKPGKLVYFSMGTIGCSELKMMQRLISILAKSPNRFIVSKGPLGHKLSLAENMWGENNLPQIDVLSLVDLVITHGGGNTVKESFYFGKPMIILPLFADQLDYAQRIHELGLGIRLHSHNVQENEL